MELLIVISIILILMVMAVPTDEQEFMRLETLSLGSDWRNGEYHDPQHGWSLSHRPIDSLSTLGPRPPCSFIQLEQSFNSLDAQREACQAYILSQRQEGWRAIDAHYDDGGYSGGSMERPGLKRLLIDIEAKKVDTVVVHKVDRLTRSLADFAKMVEAFDDRGVSFGILAGAMHEGILMANKIVVLVRLCKMEERVGALATAGSRTAPVGQVAVNSSSLVESDSAGNLRALVLLPNSCRRL